MNRLGFLLAARLLAPMGSVLVDRADASMRPASNSERLVREPWSKHSRSKRYLPNGVRETARRRRAVA